MTRVVSSIVHCVTRRKAGSKYNDQPERQRKHGGQFAVALRYLNIMQRLVGSGSSHAQQASKRWLAQGSRGGRLNGCRKLVSSPILRAGELVGLSTDR